MQFRALGPSGMLAAIQISSEYENPRENLGTLMYQRARLSKVPDRYFERAIRSWNAVIKINPGTSRIWPPRERSGSSDF